MLLQNYGRRTESDGKPSGTSPNGTWVLVPFLPAVAGFHCNPETHRETERVRDRERERERESERQRDRETERHSDRVTE